MRYTVILEQEADGGYVATVPALPGCVSQGDTRDEVMRNIREAADLYVEDCIAAGDPVPTEAGKEYCELKTGTHHRPGVGESTSAVCRQPPTREPHRF
jgi:predicted RNase H-like HicB family nuclease